MDTETLNNGILSNLSLAVICYLILLILACFTVAWAFWDSVKDSKELNKFIKRLEEGEEYD